MVYHQWNAWLGSKCSKARTAALYCQTCSLSSRDVESGRVLGRNRFCLLLMGRARRKHLNSIKKTSSVWFITLSRFQVQKVWNSVHTLFLRLRQVYESHEAPRWAGSAEWRGGCPHHLPALLQTVLHSVSATVSLRECAQSLRVDK